MKLHAKTVSRPVLICALVMTAACGQSYDRNARVKEWELEPGHKAGVIGLAFSPDGQRIYSVDIHGGIIVWEPATGKVLRSFQAQRQTVGVMALSADCKLLATGSNDSTIKIFDAETGRELRTLTEHIREIYGLAFSPDGRRLVSTDGHGVARLWDTSTWQVVHKWGGPRVAKDIEFSASGDPAFSADGRTLVVRGRDRDVWHFDGATGQTVRRAELEPIADPKDSRRGRFGVMRLAESKAWSGVSIAPEAIYLWEKRTKIPKKIEGTAGLLETRESYWVPTVALARDEQWLALSFSNKVYLVDLASGKRMHTLAGHINGVRQLVFSPDGKVLASGSYDCTVKLWDVATGRALRNFGSPPPPSLDDF